MEGICCGNDVHLPSKSAAPLRALRESRAGKGLSPLTLTIDSRASP